MEENELKDFIGNQIMDIVSNIMNEYPNYTVTVSVKKKEQVEENVQDQ